MLKLDLHLHRQKAFEMELQKFWVDLEGFLIVVREKVKNENDATFLDVYDVFASQNGHFSHLAENLKVIHPFKAKKVTFRERNLQKV